MTARRHDAAPPVSRAVAAGCVLLGLMLGGCASLQPDAQATSMPASAAPADVIIEAPEELRALLDRHLDLARLARDAAGETLTDSELRRLVNATPAEARALLATEGYMDADVRAEREDAALSTRVRPLVRIRVRPGARTQVESADLRVVGDLADAAKRGDTQAKALINEWQAAWRLPPGAAFSNTAWRDAKSALIARLRGTGYAAASLLSSAAEVDAGRARATLSVEAASGPLFRTGPLMIEGLERQDHKSVRNLADFEPGTVATDALLLDYQERLQGSGLFERSTVSLDPDPAHAETATVTVRVKEAALQQATVGVGISANTGPRISLEHVHRNLFDWRATLRNKIEWGNRRKAWEGELASHAMPGLYRNLLGGGAERLDSDTDRVSSVRARVGRSYDTQRIDRLVFVEAERVRTWPVVAGVLANATRSDTLSATLNFHGIWRDLDSIVLPTRGDSYAVQTGVGQVHSTDSDGNSTQGSGPFARVHLRGQWWRPIGERWYAQARLEIGQVYARDNVEVPETQRFRAGGDDSVRGYAWRSLTPQVAGVDVGGRVIGTASLEIARPVSESLPSVWWAAFVDAGRAAARWNDFKPAWGAGLGLRWRSPVGPLRADVAYGEEVRDWRLHLSVGIAF
ncbi:MAG: BamA/TamA family outer membrane protein [Aquincola sp.]|nr:BamA/TamA family outer membrane protein [Aquincola sp.]